MICNTISNPLNSTGELEELRTHNEALENSSEFQRILPEVKKEIYTLFVKEEMKYSENLLKSPEDEESIFSGLHESMRASAKEKIEKAKELMPNNPEQAAQVFMQLGSCHRLWAMQKNILKEKYGITWYNPAELNPDVKFD